MFKKIILIFCMTAITSAANAGSFTFLKIGLGMFVVGGATLYGVQQCSSKERCNLHGHDTEIFEGAAVVTASGLCLMIGSAWAENQRRAEIVVSPQAIAFRYDW